MDIIFICILAFLIILACFDLVAGVSNDAVNFLNSAIGAKAAPFKVILGVAAVGIFLGASLSNGMMEVARNGIYNPAYFTFQEVMTICLAAVVTDIILINIFNTLGLPTSTTVSMVFEILGAAFCMAMLKGFDDPNLQVLELLNTSKALQVIIAIFLSVAVAFFFGSVVQWVTRVLFSFNYKKTLPYLAGIFGGIALTSIVYFMLIKGLQESTFAYKDWVSEHTSELVIGSLIGFSILMQVLHWCRVNILKIIVLAGTLALSLAFAGNDLVNFIGVPLSGLSAYQDYMAHGNGAYDTYLMAANNLPAKTPYIFLLGSGIIMTLALFFSKSAQNVIKTSVNLSRQDDGEETFGSSRIARGLVRTSSSISSFLERSIPKKTHAWIDSRFNKQELTMEPGAAFDLVRASVNLVLAGLLIALGTSFKLPLSTSYVTFIVGMGSSLADRAWGRESAVGRLTGVMSVIGGWFVTAGAAFIIAIIIATIMRFGGFIAMIALIAVALFLLFNSHLIRRKKGDADDELFVAILNAEDPTTMWSLLSEHVRTNQTTLLDHVSQDYLDLTNGLFSEDLRRLKKTMHHLDEHKRAFKTMRRKETIGLRRMASDEDMLEKNMWFHLGANTCLQMIYALERATEVSVEHVDNNYNPIPEEYRTEFAPIRDRVIDYIAQVHQLISSERMEDAKKAKNMGKELREIVKDMRKTQMKRAHKSRREDLRASMVYLNILIETNELLGNLRHLVGYSQNLLDEEAEG